MAAHHPEGAQSLALAMVAASGSPLLLIDGNFELITASASFGRDFRIDVSGSIGRPIFALGDGRWDLPPLHVLLNATLAGPSDADTFEMSLDSDFREPRRLVLSASKLHYDDVENVRLLLAVTDVTDTRAVAALMDETLRQKAVLFQELQHRIANSLQIIASIIIESSRRVGTEEARNHLHDAHTRVLSVAMLQDHLAATSAENVNMGAYLGKLCSSLSASMIGGSDRLTLTVEADDSSVAAEISVSLGLIVTELVINALKHAFPDRRPGKILVGYHTTGEAWTLSVDDDGVGMPGDDAKTKPGLGSYIIEALVKQLNAHVELDETTPGTRVRITHAPNERHPPIATNGLRLPERAGAV
jgi:two-component system, sensor histidine kinase PdtaS